MASVIGTVDFEEPATGGLELDAVAAPIGRIGGARDQLTVLELVDERDDVALVGTKPVGELLLGECAEVAQRDQDAVLGGVELMLGERESGYPRGSRLATHPAT